MLNRFVTDLIENTQRRVQEAGVNSLDELRRYPERLAAFSPEVEVERREAKAFSSKRSTTSSSWSRRSVRRRRLSPMCSSI